MSTAGCRALALVDPVQRAPIPLRVLYPTNEPERPEQLGPYPVAVALDAPVEGRELPLVVLSHGNNGSPLTNRGLAMHLARAGFVVAMPEHPGNSRSDTSLAGTTAILEHRPRHLRVVLDAVYEAFGQHLSAGRVGIVGESIGGYTALAAAGGRPMALPHEVAEGASRALDVTADPRIGALVLLSPATFWFMADGALSDVTVPILMRTGDHDEVTPPFHAEIVLRGVRDRSRVDHVIVANAGHFSFQTPFPASMVRPEFPPAHDPPGFDRAAYQPLLHADVEAFFRKTL